MEFPCQVDRQTIAKTRSPRNKKTKTRENTQGSTTGPKDHTRHRSGVPYTARHPSSRPGRRTDGEWEATELCSLTMTNASKVHKWLSACATLAKIKPSRVQHTWESECKNTPTCSSSFGGNLEFTSAHTNHLELRQVGLCSLLAFSWIAGDPKFR